MKKHHNLCTYKDNGIFYDYCKCCYDIFHNKKIKLQSVIEPLKNGFYYESNIMYVRKQKIHFFFDNIQLCNLSHDDSTSFLEKWIKVLDLTDEKRVCKRCLHIISTWNDLNNYITFHN